MYCEVVTELYDHCELAGLLAHVECHCGGGSGVVVRIALSRGCVR
jgi:hypothetical protein